MSTSIIITITDDAGKPVSRDIPEPEPGSVVLINGEFGTAFQRYFGGDGLWHRVGGGRGKTWQQMLTQRNLVLVYRAAVRAAVLT
jgi:hypothetical protein